MKRKIYHLYYEGNIANYYINFGTIFWVIREKVGSILKIQLLNANNKDIQ